jgi:nucleoside-diphosphate-sugar epimerase
MRALVTGATGFLGQSVVRQLLGAGVAVRCFARPSSDVQALQGMAAAAPGGELEIVRGSLQSPEACIGAVRDCDVVFHLAAELRGAAAVLFQSNVIGTRVLLDAAARAGCGRLVVVSSLAVHGTGHLPSWAEVDESCPLDPEPHRRDTYTYSKVTEEEVAWAAHRERQLPLVVVRPGVIYGPGRDCISGRLGLRMGNWLVRMGGGQPLPYTFVENCARAIVLAGTVAGIEGEAFNVVDDHPPTSRQLAKLYRGAVGPLRTVPVPGWAVSPLSGLCEWYHRWSHGQLPAVLTRYKSRAMWRPFRYSNAKAKARLGWQPETAFAEGLEQTFTWLRQRRAAGQPTRA